MARAGSVIDAPGVDPSQDNEQLQSQDQRGPSKVGFFQFLSEFTTEQWEQLLLYVYRLAPITDRLASGNQTKYLMKYAGRIDEDVLKIDHGSGRYRLQLNQIDAKGKSKTIKTVEVEIEDPAHPPKVPDGEWIDDPRNKRWAWARKKQEPEVAAQPQAPVNPLDTVRMVKDMIREMMPAAPKEDQASVTRAVLDAVKETRSELAAAADPSKTISMIKDLITTFIPKQEAKSDDGSPLMKLLLAQLDQANKATEAARQSAEAERQRNHELQLKMMEQKQSGGDILDTVDKVLGIRERLADLGGGGDTGPRNWKETGMALLRENAPQLMAGINGLLSAVSMRSYAAAPNPAQQPAAVQAPTIDVQAQPAPGVPAVQQQPPPTPLADLSPEENILRAAFMERGAFVVQKFKGGMAGSDFADLFTMLAGEMEYERVRNIGKERILAVVQTIPPMAADLAGLEPQFDQFIQDFIDPPSDEEPPAVVEPKAKGKK